MELTVNKDTATICLPEVMPQRGLADFHGLVQEVIKQRVRTLYLDCGRVSLIDSLLTGALIKTLKNTRDNDCSLILTNVSQDNLETLEQASLDTILTIQRDGSVKEPESELGVTLNATVKKETVVILFSGMMNGLDDAATLKAKVQSFLPTNVKFIFDFSDTIYIDSLGVGEIVNVHRKIKQAEGKLVFCGANEILRDLLKGLGLLQIIPYFRDQEEALRNLNPV